MKHLQYFQKRKPASIDISVEAPGFEDKRRDDNALKIYKQTLSGSEDSSNNPNVADWIRNHCVCVLMFALVCHAVVCKFKNSYAKDVLATEDALKILRVVFLAVRNITPAQQQKIQSTITTFVNQLSYSDLHERLLTLFKTIAPGLSAQIDTISATSETVVSILWAIHF